MYVVLIFTVNIFLHSAEANKGIGSWQIATAVVSSTACMIKECCDYVGKTATGEADGCTPHDCTEAKDNAQHNLRKVIPEECSRSDFITTSCQKYFCN